MLSEAGEGENRVRCWGESVCNIRQPFILMDGPDSGFQRAASTIAYRSPRVVPSDATYASDLYLYSFVAR